MDSGGVHNSAAHPPRDDHRRGRRAMTLIELMMVIAILGILAAIVVPRIASEDQSARGVSMASTVRHIRGLIQYHAGAGDVAIGASGYPLDVDADWFRGNTLPEHLWTEQPLIIEVVAGPAATFFPLTKTYNSAVPGDPNAWYNSANGSFCVRVPATADVAADLASFNTANAAECTALNQTSK